MAKLGGEYSIGSGHWPGLSKLIEEAGEVCQVAGKIMGTGGERMHWDGSDLKVRIEEEIADVLAACAFVIEACELDETFITDRIDEKITRFRDWHKNGV